MSVRRLADEAVQPPTFAFSEDNARWAERKIAEYPAGRQQSAVIPLLMRAQDQDGWISRAAIESIAKMLGMPYIRVLEVATFYTQFQLKPVGTRAHIQVCGTTPCMLRGAEDIRSVCQRKIHPEPFHLNDDGTLSWEEVECLGACVNAPMVAIFHDTYEDLTPARMEEIIDAFAAGRGDTVRPGPQIARIYSAPEAGASTLTEEPTARRERTAPLPSPAAPAQAAQPAAAAPAQEPTTPGRKREVSEEAAPAIKSPGGPETKVTTAEAEAERNDAGASSLAADTDAMRPGATGAESPAGKIDEGRAPDKPVANAPGDGASAAGVEDRPARKVRKQLLDRPEGPADNLKLITGIGPGIEKALNEIGIVTYAQLGKLTQEQIALVEGELGFRGRVARDNWLAQADALAVGGIEEYRRRFGKDPR
ncbi:NADH-quinone oxidoreductase subunit E [Devosia enhydra]|uniref:NADH-quinone oxidoreductase subunit E n=1 Tax=Devosia enhydra TaxID=665118 RepID=A0A1K2HVA1_9HYPH|nr:NADH-quinone oxidoreductase subunit NuoE [Devosia enhydra]SFZ82629.1 NADH-quinone oxidoreductase subunit E [Devosia enhydra]